MPKLLSLFLLVILSLPAHAANHKWWKRIGEVAVCGFAAFDTKTTFDAYARDPGGSESSPLLADSHGKPSPLRFGIVKGAMCAGAIVLGESRMSPIYSMPIMGALAFPEAWAGAQNLKIKPEK